MQFHCSLISAAVMIELRLCCVLHGMLMISLCLGGLLSWPRRVISGLKINVESGC